MTLTALAFLIILITMPVSLGVVKLISWAYETKDNQVMAAKRTSLKD